MFMRPLHNSLLLTLLGLCISSCGGGGGNDDQSGDSQFAGSCALRITNGSQCQTGSGPVVLLELYDQSQTLVATCSGAFISSTHVLTGAHCFDGGISSAQIRFGNNRIRSKSIAIPSTYQAGVNSLSDSDFAVVTLESTASGAEILPILSSETIRFDQTFNIIGFGQDENGNSALQGNDYEESLKKCTMVINDISIPLRAFAASFNETGQSVCSGDSGGPAIAVNRDGLAGIIGVAQAVSDPNNSQEPQCLEDTIAVFTDVQNSANLNFILSIAPETGLI